MQARENLFKQWQGLLTGVGPHECIHPIAFLKNILRNVSNLCLIGTSNTLNCSRCSDNKVRKREKYKEERRDRGGYLLFQTFPTPTSHCFSCSGYVCEEIIYCYSVILLSLIKIWKANVEIIYSLVLTSFSRKQPVDLLSVNLFVKS